MPLVVSQDTLCASALVVDDEPAIRRLLTRILSGCGIKVTAVPNAAAALAWPGDMLDFDLVLTDLEMPGPSGLDLARSLRTRGVHLPIVFVTGCPDRVVRFVFEDGNAWYVGKPFTSDEIASVLRSVLDGPHSRVRPVPQQFAGPRRSRNATSVTAVENAKPGSSPERFPKTNAR